ncbi:Cysteine-rich receptor-like protein kinase 2 [Linum grandiflorum]
MMIVIIFLILFQCHQQQPAIADPRSQTVNVTCDTQLEANPAIFVPNFVATMENISDQMRTSGFGIAEAGDPGPDRNYGLAQCYGDLSLLDCVLCYAEARTILPQCYPFNGGRIFLDGCFMRAENYTFFDQYSGPQDRAVCGNATNPETANFAPFQDSVRRALQQAVANAPGNGGFWQGTTRMNSSLSVFVLANCWKTLNPSSCRLCLKNASSTLAADCLPRSTEGRALNTGCFLSSLNFKYSTLEKATRSFDEANKLGQGGFGSVYKGVLADGREIAVKRLFFNNKHRVADFFNEVNMISTVEHKNLVRLLGCSCSGPESLLVYEFLHNRSLDFYIFDANKGKAMTWDKRYEVIVGTAEGLVYLHENSKIRIIHRDIKASNILLDSRLRAKIADFGLASFGVLLLEIVTGRQNNRSKSSEYTDSLVTSMWRQFQDGSVEELFDPNLILHNHHNSNVKDDVLRVVHVALLCTQESPSIRPSMSNVLQMLTTEELLPPPTNPPFIDERTMELGDACEDPSFPLNIGLLESVATVDNSDFHPR